MTDRAKVIEFPLDRRAEQIAEDLSVDARLADALRPLTLRLMTTVVPPLPGDEPLDAA